MSHLVLHFLLVQHALHHFGVHETLYLSLPHHVVQLNHAQLIPTHVHDNETVLTLMLRRGINQ